MISERCRDMKFVKKNEKSKNVGHVCLSHINHFTYSTRP